MKRFLSSILFQEKFCSVNKTADTFPSMFLGSYKVQDNILRPYVDGEEMPGYELLIKRKQNLKYWIVISVIILYYTIHQYFTTDEQWALL